MKPAGTRSATLVLLVAAAWGCASMPVLAASKAAKSAKPAVTRAEIQLALCGEPEAIERALALRPREAPYETWLFDTPTLALLNQGIRLRLRVREGASELTVKVANQNCEAIPTGLVARPNGKCEYDMHGDQLAGAVSLSRSLDTAATTELLAGRLPPANALSAAQIRYLREGVHAWPLPTGLRALGPIRNNVYATPGNAHDIDVTRLPGGERYTEISVKVPLANAVPARRALEDHLARSGVQVCADQSGQAAAKLRALLARP